MSDWAKRYLGWDHFPAMLEALEIESFFTLVGGELAVIQAHRRDTNRLAIAIQVGYMRMTGMALNSVEMIPSAVLAHVADQLAQPLRSSLRSGRSIAAGAPSMIIRKRHARSWGCARSANTGGAS